MTRYVVVGSDTRIESGHRKEGITVYQMDPESGRLAQVQKAVSGETPAFLAIHPGGKFIYAINEVRDGRATAFTVDESSGQLALLNTASVKGLGPCYISLSQDGRWALVSNYGGGSLSVLPIQPDGAIGEAVCTVQHHGKGDDPRRQEAPHAHSIIPSPDGRFALAADLGTNRIYVYRLDDSGTLIPNDPPWAQAEAGAGPRHMAFHPSGNFLYVANELNNTVVVNAWDAASGTLQKVQVLSTLPEDFAASAPEAVSYVADIHLTPSGGKLPPAQFLYVSNRGHDSLAVYQVAPDGSSLQLLGFVSTGGHWPRNFTLDPEGNFLIVANQESDSLVLFKIDPATGLPAPTGEVVSVEKPMFVTIVDLKR